MTVSDGYEMRIEKITFDASAAARGFLLRLDHVAGFAAGSHQCLNFGKHAETCKVVEELLLLLVHELFDNSQHYEVTVFIVLRKKDSR